MKATKYYLVLMIFLCLGGCSNVFLEYMSIPYTSVQNAVEDDESINLREIEDILEYRDLVIWPIMNNSKEIFGAQYMLGIKVEEFEQYDRGQLKPFIFVLGFKVKNNNVQITPYTTELNFGDSKLKPEEVLLIEPGESCLKVIKEGETTLNREEIVEISKSHNNFSLVDSSWKCLRFKFDMKSLDPRKNFNVNIKYYSDAYHELNVYFIPTLVKYKQTH